MHEHKTPVDDLFKEIMESDGSVQTIVKILMSMQIVWILRTENKRLKRSGRGDAHDRIYADANIVLVKDPRVS